MDKIKELKKRLTHIVSSTNGELLKLEEIRDIAQKITESIMANEKIMLDQEKMKEKNKKSIDVQNNDICEAEKRIKKSNKKLQEIEDTIISLDKKSNSIIKDANDEADKIIKTSRIEADKIKEDKTKEDNNLFDEMENKKAELSILDGEIICKTDEIDDLNSQKELAKIELEKSINAENDALHDESDAKKKSAEADKELSDINKSVKSAKKELSECEEKLSEANDSKKAILLEIDGVKNDRRSEKKELDKIREAKDSEEKKWKSLEERRLAFVEKETGYNQSVIHIREVYKKAKVQCPI